MASVSAASDVSRHCDINDRSLISSGTRVERPSNQSRIAVVTTALLSCLTRRKTTMLVNTYSKLEALDGLCVLTALANVIPA